MLGRKLREYPASILGDPGADRGRARESLNRREKKWRKENLDFPSPPLSAPGSPRMSCEQKFLLHVF